MKLLKRALSTILAIIVFIPIMTITSKPVYAMTYERRYIGLISTAEIA